jgi:hypothetical protein
MSGNYRNLSPAMKESLKKHGFEQVMLEYDRSKIPYIAVKLTDKIYNGRYALITGATAIKEKPPSTFGGATRRRRSTSKPKTRSKTSKRRSRSKYNA